MVGERVGQEDRLDHRQRAAPAVEGVRAGVGVADRVDADRERAPAVVDEAAEAVDQPAHRPDTAERLERAVGEEPVGAGQQPAGQVEPVRRGQGGPQLAVVRGDGQRHRQGPAVAGDAEELQEAEVAAQLGVPQRLRALGVPVPAGEVHQAALDHLLGDRHPGVRQPGGQGRAPPPGHHDEVGVEDAAVPQPDPADGGRSPVPGGIGHQARDRDAGTDLDAVLGQDRPAQDPVDRGAPHDQDGQVLVARPWLAEVGGRRHRGAADRQEVVEDVGEPVAQQHLEAGEESVGLVRLRRPAPLGAERLVGIGAGRQRVALEEGHTVAGPGERERAPQAADASADDGHPEGCRHGCRCRQISVSSRTFCEKASCSGVGAALPIDMSFDMSPWTLIWPDMNACIAACWSRLTNSALATS